MVRFGKARRIDWNCPPGSSLILLIEDEQQGGELSRSTLNPRFYTPWVEFVLISVLKDGGRNPARRTSLGS
jgi:hypothetical protein